MLLNDLSDVACLVMTVGYVALALFAVGYEYGAREERRRNAK